MTDGPQRVREWTLGEEIGRGGMGIVYRATHLYDAGEFAVKVIRPELARDPEARARFLRETRHARRLDHPHVVRTELPFEEGDRLYLPMELLSGQTLARLLEADAKPWAPTKAAEYVRQAAAGLGHAHGQGIIHRDIKPGNLFVVERPQGVAVKVLDFGLSRALGDESLTSAGMAVGTPIYLAPEILDGQPPTPAADVYGLGVVLYRLLTGALPVSLPADATSLLAIVMALGKAHLKGLPRVSAAVPAVPGWLDDLVARMLAREPAERPADGAEVARLLEVGGAAVPARAEPPPPASEPPPPASEPPPDPSVTRFRLPTFAEPEPPPPPPPRAEPPTPAAFDLEPPAAPEDRRTGLLVGGLVAVLAAIGAVVWFAVREDGPTEAPAAQPVVQAEIADLPVETPDAGSIWRELQLIQDSDIIPLRGSPSRGPADALVTIVEFADFQCPFCFRAVETLEQLRSAYGNELRIVFKHQPLGFHPRAEPAAHAAMAAHAQLKFWEMHDRLFASPDRDQLERDDFLRHARDIGLDLEAFGRALDEKTHDRAIKADVELAGKLGATGTPTFFINGVRLLGAQPLTKFQEVVEAQMAAAEAALREGTPRRELYATLVRKNYEPPKPSAAKDGEADDIVHKVQVKPEDHFLGLAGAPVTVVAFSDFECPFCSRAAATMHTLQQTSGGQVRVVFKHNPLAFHRNAFQAAEAALAAGAQGKFWPMHDKLFANQRALSRSDLERFAKELGLDVRRFRRDLDSRRFKAQIEADMAQAAALGASGTPTFFVNGRKLVGAQPLERFREAVEVALKER